VQGKCNIFGNLLATLAGWNLNRFAPFGATAGSCYDEGQKTVHEGQSVFITAARMARPATPRQMPRRQSWRWGYQLVTRL
jgi:hypothetical protein